MSDYDGVGAGDLLTIEEAAVVIGQQAKQLEALRAESAKKDHLIRDLLHGRPTLHQLRAIARKQRATLNRYNCYPDLHQMIRALHTALLPPQESNDAN